MIDTVAPTLATTLATPHPGLTDPPPTSAAQLLARLQGWGIAADTHAHAPVFTVAEAKALHGPMAGGHSKNLFLKDKGGALFLVVAHQDSPLDLKALPAALGCGRLSFGKPELLWSVLGVVPGSVSPLALINDTARLVTPVFERRLLALGTLYFHPLRNDCTTALTAQALLRFVAACGHVPQVLDLPLKADAPLEPAGADAHV